MGTILRLGRIYYGAGLYVKGNRLCFKRECVYDDGRDFMSPLYLPPTHGDLSPFQAQDPLRPDQTVSLEQRPGNVIHIGDNPSLQFFLEAIKV